ncbi:MAG: S41 family peptidase [bacterium]|nr:S41 family peptidase [bacterium]
MNRESRKVDVSTMVVISGVMLIVGFIGGTRKTELLNLVSPVFGLQKQTNELDLNSVQETFKTLIAKFDGNIDKNKLIEGASKGLVNATGDKFTTYMDSKEAEEFNKNLSGDIGAGIGVEIGIRNNLPTVIRALKNNPAIESGIQSGDIILEVNSESVSGMSIDEITSKIKGEAGTSVKIKISRNKEEKEFSITRAKISNPSVELNISDKIAILTISRFDNETGNLAKKYAQEIKQKGISKVILDLRGNGGGYVTAAQSVASLWLEKGSLIVSEKKGTKTVDEVRADGDNILAGVETIVIADGSSASASEIVVGALKDHKVARFYGVKTYGKGSVQEPIKINNGAILKVTIAKWYTPNGKNINGEGISPDKEVKITSEQINSGQDPQLDFAKEALK